MAKQNWVNRVFNVPRNFVSVKLVEDGRPLVYFGLPPFIKLYGSQLNQLYDSHIRGECTFGFGHLSDHSVVPFNRVGGVDQFA